MLNTKTNVKIFSSESVCLDNTHSINVRVVRGKCVLSVKKAK